MNSISTSQVSFSQSIKLRFPSHQHIFIVLSVCLVPIHVWAFMAFLHKVPSYLLRFNVGEIISILAYVLAFALLESLLFLGAIVLLAFVLPRHVILDRFISQGTILALTTMLWIIPIHYKKVILKTLSLKSIDASLVNGFWLISFLLILVGLSIQIRRFPKFELIIIAFADRLTVLGVLFLALDIVSVFIVAFRNIFF